MSRCNAKSVGPQTELCARGWKAKQCAMLAEWAWWKSFKFNPYVGGGSRGE